MTDRPIIIHNQRFPTVAAAARYHDVSRQTIYRWLARDKYGPLGGRGRAGQPVRRKLTESERAMLDRGT